MNDLLELLAAGGDVFTIGVCLALYRLDNRVRLLELKEAARVGNQSL